jgi:UDP-N-acetylmuramate: L-alanyl-gamma-D-glutamyl-meso-diaminopimelate ligase
LIEKGGLDPSVLVGGITKDFGHGYKLGKGDYFVIEGDEYDSAYFEKFPKFLSYAPHAAVITSVEHDHIDIYPSKESYQAAFNSFAKLINPGPVAVYAGDPVAVKIAGRAACKVITYGVKGDPLPVLPAWYAEPLSSFEFKLLIDGKEAGTWRTALAGQHNLRNALAALIMAHEAAHLSLNLLKESLVNFGGIERRQQIIGTPGGITIYDDFAHHPTAVKETIRALKSKHKKNRLIVAFEPRSATACRKMHQQAYALAFDDADLAIIAPPGRTLPENEMLNTEQLAYDLKKRKKNAIAALSTEQVQDIILQHAKPGDIVVLLSNGSFGGLHNNLKTALDKKG